MLGDALPTSRGRRGPYAKSEHTRKAILDSALQVFAESGYRGGSLRGVADRVGMSEAGLLHHFPSKSALLAAVLERRDERNEQQFDLDVASGLDWVRSLIRLADHNASAPGVVQLFCTLSAEATSPDHPARSYFVERYARARQTALAAFQEMESHGQLAGGVRPESAARGVVAMMDGLQVQWLLDHAALDMAEELTSYLQSLVTVDL